jgi:galactosamine-6-phosphate isomerase
MEIVNVKNFEELSEAASKMMIDEVKNNPHPNICLATGGSPKLAYRMFTEKVLKENINLSHVVFSKLDEWCGLEPDHEATCEKYIQDLIIKPLGISKKNYISFVPNAEDFKREAATIQQALVDHPISLCILGLGKNGHLGLNEPKEYLTSDVHVAPLDKLTKTHSMISDYQVEAGITIGMSDIFASKKILMLVTGKNKAEIVKQFFTKKITTALPASLLWLHPNTTLLVQEDLYPM